MILIKTMQQAKRVSGVLLLVLFTVTAFGQIPEIHAATRIAFVGSGGNDGVGNDRREEILPLRKDYPFELRARFKIRLGQVLSKGFCEHDGCETKRIQLI